MFILKVLLFSHLTAVRLWTCFSIHSLDFFQVPLPVSPHGHHFYEDSVAMQHRPSPEVSSPSEHLSTKVGLWNKLENEKTQMSGYVSIGKTVRVKDYFKLML